MGVAPKTALARRAALLTFVALVLAACGRRGEPEAPTTADPRFPRQYPTR